MLIKDFEGMNESELTQLWNRIGNRKIGIRNRFMKSIKTISFKPVIVVTDEERTILSNLKQTIKKYQSITEAHETSLTGMPAQYGRCVLSVKHVQWYMIIDLNKMHNVQLEAIRQDCERIRTAVNQREDVLITLLNENHKHRQKYIQKGDRTVKVQYNRIKKS